MQFQSLEAITDNIIAHPQWDIIVLLILIAGGFFYGLSTGKAKIAARILYTYAAFAVVSALPIERLASLFSDENVFFLRAGVFFLFFLLLSFFLGSRRSGGRFISSSDSWWRVFILSFLQIGLLIHLVLYFIPEEEMEFIAPLTRYVFAHPDLHIWWLVLPLAVTIFFKRGERSIEKPPQGQ